MSCVRHALILAVSGFALSACAYAPASTEPRWTDAQLEATPPGEAPDYVRDERLSPMTYFGFDAYERILGQQRDDVQAEAATIPEPEGRSEDYAAEARQRATPPNPD